MKASILFLTLSFLHSSIEFIFYVCSLIELNVGHHAVQPTPAPTTSSRYPWDFRPGDEPPRDRVSAPPRGYGPGGSGTSFLHGGSGTSFLHVSCGFCSMQVSHPFILLIRRRVDDRLGRNPIRPRVGLLPFAGSPRGMTGTGGSGTSSLHVDCSFCSIHISYPFILLSASVTILSFPAQVSFVFGVRPRSRGSLPRANGFPSVLSAPTVFPRYCRPSACPRGISGTVGSGILSFPAQVSFVFGVRRVGGVHPKGGPCSSRSTAGRSLACWGGERYVVTLYLS